MGESEIEGKSKLLQNLSKYLGINPVFLKQSSCSTLIAKIVILYHWPRLLLLLNRLNCWIQLDCISYRETMPGVMANRTLNV